MTHNQPIFYIARLVLETCTPLSIASGRTDGIADNLIVRDANGLPAIPGSSLAGVLRHLYQHLNDEDQTNQLFGSGKQSLDDKEPSTEEQETGNPSFVHVSWGSLHDRTDQPLEGLLDPDAPRWDDDKIIKDAATPIRRDHVKLNHRGVTDAKKQGKFERTSLTTGHRFSVELSLWSDDENDPRWEKLLDLLQRPDFRLGGGTRRGLGKLKMVRCHTSQFNLADKGEFKKFSELTQSLADTRHLDKLEPIEPVSQISLNLTPLEGYRFGGCVEPLIENSQANLLAVTEHCVEWENAQGGLVAQKRIVIPASGVKGALSHRVAFYYNALNKVFAEKYAEQVEEHVGEKNEAVRALFGYIEENQDKTKPDIAQIGSLIFDDVYQPPSLQILEYMHNGVDRFTGGVREGVLFSEEVITDTQSFPLNITIANEEGIKPQIWKALRLALNDIAEGRLALGAGRGHGYFSAEWKNGEQWLTGHEQCNQLN